MSLDALLLAHVDPDVTALLQAMDARIDGIANQQVILGQRLANLPPVDLSGVQSAIAALEKEVAILEGIPPVNLASVQQAIAALKSEIDAVKAAQPSPPATTDQIIWSTVPLLDFVQGIKKTISIAQYVKDSLGIPLSVVEIGPLPAGVTYDPVALTFAYDGIAAGSPTQTVMLSASNGTASGQTPAPVQIAPPAPAPVVGISPDGTVITNSPAGQTLVTTHGTWSFGAQVLPGGYQVMLNGTYTNGNGTKLCVANGGQVYVRTLDGGKLYLWNGTAWGQVASNVLPQ